MSGLLQGRRGLIVGVSGETSIGGALARGLSDLGAELALTCRPARREAAAALGLPLFPVDVDDESALAATGFELALRWERLDFLVHTIMNVPPRLLARPLLELERGDFETVIGVAAHSLIHACRELAPLLERSTAPRVVALTSACSHRMTPRYHVAGIAKAALEATVVYLAQELGAKGILVNAVSPSLLATDGALRTIGPENAAATRALQARKAATRRAVELDDVTGCVAWLVSPLCRQVTAEIVTVDGGFARGYL